MRIPASVMVLRRRCRAAGMDERVDIAGDALVGSGAAAVLVEGVTEFVAHEWGQSGDLDEGGKDPPRVRQWVR